MKRLFTSAQAPRSSPTGPPNQQAPAPTNPSAYTGASFQRQDSFRPGGGPHGHVHSASLPPTNTSYASGTPSPPYGAAHTHPVPVHQQTYPLYPPSTQSPAGVGFLPEPSSGYTSNSQAAPIQPQTTGSPYQHSPSASVSNNYGSPLAASYGSPTASVPTQAMGAQSPQAGSPYTSPPPASASPYGTASPTPPSPYGYPGAPMPNGSYPLSPGVIGSPSPGTFSDVSSVSSISSPQSPSAQYSPPVPPPQHPQRPEAGKLPAQPARPSSASGRPSKFSRPGSFSALTPNPARLSNAFYNAFSRPSSASTASSQGHSPSPSASLSPRPPATPPSASNGSFPQLPPRPPSHHSPSPSQSTILTPPYGQHVYPGQASTQAPAANQPVPIVLPHVCISFTSSI
jgi:hypothetical protein